MSTQTVSFPSAEVRLAADLYLPEGATGPVPAAAYGPGFGGVKENR